jgi:hypothetical protein
MPETWSKYQLVGLQQLVQLKSSLPYSVNGKKHAPQEIAALHKNIENFVDVFCNYELADNDYFSMQVSQQGYGSVSDWLQQAPLEQVIKYISYTIWTDKVAPGFFIQTINDGSLHQALARLENILQGNWQL